MHLALLALGIDKGDEVITTPFTFIAPANAVLYIGARPVFVDIHPTSLNMDPDRIEAAITPRTKAIIAVENFGNPMHLEQICAVAKKHGIPVIEDACEGFGSTHRERPIGSFGRLAVFGFYPNKPITTAEGGMIMTDDPHLATLCRSMRNQGRHVSPVMHSTHHHDEGDGNGDDGSIQRIDNLGSWLQHERLGFNYRMSELHAALGVAQMRRLEQIVEKRNAVASRYFEKLAGNPDVILPNIDPQTMMSWFVFVVLLASDFSEDDRNEIIQGFRRHEIGVSHYFPPIHLQPFYRARFGYREGMYPICERIAQRTIALPFFNHLTDRDIDLVCQTLEVMIQRTRFKRSPGDDDV